MCTKTIFFDFRATSPTNMMMTLEALLKDSRRKSTMFLTERTSLVQDSMPCSIIIRTMLFTSSRGCITGSWKGLQRKPRIFWDLTRLSMIGRICVCLITKVPEFFNKVDLNVVKLLQMIKSYV